VRFHIIGAVNSPGVYTLSPGALVQDAIQAAGGPSADADLETLNLATMIRDQQQIIVPRLSPALIPGSRTITLEGSDDDLVNINTADSATLQTLPGIGPVLAGRIIDYRNEHGPFNTIDDLSAIKGIGETRLEQLRALVSVGP
jgi:competence protein ComEA